LGFIIVRAIAPLCVNGRRLTPRGVPTLEPFAVLIFHRHAKTTDRDRLRAFGDGSI
jgi:hypothetical protein